MHGHVRTTWNNLLACNKLNLSRLFNIIRLSNFNLKTNVLRSFHTEQKRKQKFSLMFAVYSVIYFTCRVIFFAFAYTFTWCE